MAIASRGGDQRPLRRSVDVWLIAFLAVASLAAILRVGLVPDHPDNGVAVIYAPWTSAEQTMARATALGARFVRYGRFDFIAIVMPERADYVRRALTSSALLVMDPQALAACLNLLTASKAAS